METGTTPPGDVFTGSITLDHEFDVNTNRATLILGGSPSKTLGLRFAARYQESDGYVYNQIFDREGPGIEEVIARLSVAWEPTDSLLMVAKLTYIDTESEGQNVITPVVDPSLLADVFAGTSMLGLTNVIGTIAALAVPGYTSSAGDYAYDSWTGNVRFNDGDFESTRSAEASVRFDWGLGNYTLTSLTGYSDFEFSQNHDLDFHGGNVIHNLDAESLEQFSQELRIASDFDGRFNFIGGLYFEHQDLFITAIPTLDGSLNGVFGALPAGAFVPGLPPELTLSDLGINSLWNGALLAPGTPLAVIELIDIGRFTSFDQAARNKAVFAEARFDLNAAWTLEVGLRYSKDSRKVRKQASVGLGGPGNYVTVIDPDGRPTGAVGPAETAFLGVIWGVLLNSWPHNQNLKRTEHHLDPAVRLRWQAADNTMMYLSWTQGYKSGGFNFSADTANPDGSPRDDTEYENERARAWELGLKATVWDGRARISTALFRTHIKDLQVTSFVGTTFQVGNAAAITAQGVEFETQIALTENLNVGASLMYLDHQYDFFPGGPCTIRQQADYGCTQQDLSGRRGPFAPKWSGTLDVFYSRPVFNQWVFSLAGTLGYNNEFYTDGDLDPNTLQDAYAKINARIALSTADYRWEFALFGRNLTDEATRTSSFDAPLSAGIYAAYIEEPRVIGVQAKFNF